jgi:hypothetical protein
MHTGNENMGRVTQDDYLKALEEASKDYQDDEDQGAGFSSEAERLAAMADVPKIRVDGKPMGAEDRKQPRKLTTSQHLFAQGLIQGKTMEQAYREAYPNAHANSQSIKSAAHKLSKDTRIQEMLNEAWGETVEALTEDVVATKRYVMKQLLALSKEGKQEGSRLRALELMARSAGMFREVDDTKVERVSAEKLRQELAGHLRLIDNVKPIKRSDVSNG